ncbi:hypothetical protein yc1106_00939 [Curvularia clavata]|uniref:RRM domain-containing protein n=1 Tax=Curvularia clavata TaxID=95742 RepID=A0A9Q8Z125_CURCL|nr:hypothetical protein yc1106_00939 [Curvularia clavata]
MDDVATHQTADRAPEGGATLAALPQEKGRQHLEAQRSDDRIVVEALTRNVKEDHIREIFGKYGVIKDVKMPMNPTFNINRGIAYVLYEEVDDAERAIAKMHDAQLDGAKIQRAEAHHQATGSKTNLRVDMDTADMAVADGDNEEEGHPAHTDHHQWTVPHATALRRAECRPTVDNGDVEEAVAVDVEDGEDVRGHIHDPEAARHGGVFPALPTAGHRRERRQDEGMAGGIAHPEELVLAVEVVEAEEEEALAIAPMAATVVGAGTAGDCYSSMVQHVEKKIK